MPEDDNLDFLHIVHIITSNADKAVASLDRKFAENPNQDDILVKVEGLMKIRNYLAAQSLLIRGTVEHQQEMRDKIFSLFENLDQ